MLIMGLDISTKTGLAFVTDVDGHVEIIRGVEVTSPLKNGQSEVERWEQYMEKLFLQIDQVQQEYGSIDRCFMEGYAFTPHQGRDTIVTQVAHGTSARMMVEHMDIPYHQVSPGNWKQFLTGSGTLKKDQIMMALFKHFGYEAKTDNIADAMVIALFGLYASASISGPAYRMDAISKWRKSKFGEVF